MGKTLKDMKYKYQVGKAVTPNKTKKVRKEYNRKKEKDWRNFIDEEAAEKLEKLEEVEING